ncbi:cupin-like domain-containing protein [Methylosinus sp. Ce-a6]|uniref:cupin-like domain-containing protein n=1 Tax=Methylosinus sp. Ce-a6 TaxID=2172005 RepID=UPI001359E71B|nr:cupin-like domain-containing protein [Methylosinus sp. Ce-a6]
MSTAYEIDELAYLSPRDFANSYVRPARPVVVRGALDACPAARDWTLEYLRRNAGAYSASLKRWIGGGIRVEQMPMSDYLDEIDRYEDAKNTGREQEPPAYLHDVPLTSVFSRAARDLASFPRDFFPSWYGADWTSFAQMFLGPTASVTPLHFDCLLTHNLFFQVWGRKRFTLLPYRELQRCYPYDWRWCEVDVEDPAHDRYPLFRDATRAVVVVGPGDVLYMPPGTLHHVKSLDCALSFNVDWHTKSSAIKGVLALARGMPIENVYYNALVALGMWMNIPARRVLPYYKAYLNYVS